jgi:hypothetical protein
MDEILLLAAMTERRRVAALGPAGTRSARSCCLLPPPIRARNPLTQWHVGQRRQGVVAEVQAVVPALDRAQVLNRGDAEA